MTQRGPVKIKLPWLFSGMCRGLDSQELDMYSQAFTLRHLADFRICWHAVTWRIAGRASFFCQGLFRV